MELFSIEDYARIELANQFGLDKLSWQERIVWATTPNEDWQKAESPIQYYNALENYRKVLAGKSSNATVTLDACSSAIQHISLIAECPKTAEICNVIGSKRNDAYSIIHQATGLPNIPRKLCKNAIMTASYNSQKVPGEIYGTNIDKLYNAMNQEAPALLQYVDLVQSMWDKNAYAHSWVMPDNFHVSIPVEKQVTSSVKFMGNWVDVTQTINAPKNSGKALPACVIHSLDSLVVRELLTRCSKRITVAPNKEMEYRLDQLADLTGFKSARILYYRDDSAQFNLPTKSFDVLSVHDAFKVLLPYANDLRSQYNQILHEIAQSRLFEFILYQLSGTHWDFHKTNPWGNQILEANYSLS